MRKQEWGWKENKWSEGKTRKGQASPSSTIDQKNVKLIKSKLSLHTQSTIAPPNYSDFVSEQLLPH